jgi:hypothetical protein
MNPYLQSRITLVLQHAYWSCVSSAPECGLAPRYTALQMPDLCHALDHRPLMSHCTDLISKLKIDETPFSYIQLP